MTRILSAALVLTLLQGCLYQLNHVTKDDTTEAEWSHVPADRVPSAEQPANAPTPQRTRQR